MSCDTLDKSTHHVVRAVYVIGGAVNLLATLQNVPN